MFGRKKSKCYNCSKEIESKFEFCPYCAAPQEKNEDYGILGKTDDLNELDDVIKHSFASPPAGKSLGDTMFNKILSNAVKMLSQEFQKIEKSKFEPKENPSRMPKMPSNSKTNFELYINGKKIPIERNIAGISISPMPMQQIERIGSQKTAKKAKKSRAGISNSTIKLAAKLPRTEAKAELKRTANQVIYELKTPGLKSIKDVLISKLENSIEIKAFTKDAVYFKTLPIKLPLTKYFLSPEEEKLVLEFKTQ